MDDNDEVATFELAAKFKEVKTLSNAIQRYRAAQTTIKTDLEGSA